MASAVESGKLEERWAKAKVGVMTNARWQNMESRLLRGYMGSASPTEEQRRMVSFVIFVYVPTFLEIRQKNLLLEGPRHFLAMINRIQNYCTQEEVELLKPVIQFNGYFAQLEVVLASMMGSQNPKERQESFGIISKLRKKENRSKRKTVRKVRNPQVNFQATRLSEMVDLKKAASSPPLFFKHNDEELRQFLQKPYSVNLPCTTIAVERGVKMTLTTEAATVVSARIQ